MEKRGRRERGRERDTCEMMRVKARTDGDGSEISQRNGGRERREEEGRHVFNQGGFNEQRRGVH